MGNSEQYLHLWAIVPPPDLAQRIDGIRKEFSVNFQCFKGLRPPVHLTLFAPYKAAIADVEAEIDAFRIWISQQPSFALELKNFSFFVHGRSPVVFIDVIANGELAALNAGITRKTQALFDLPGSGKQRFHPHITIGYRDIPKEIFPQIKEAFGQRPFHAKFDVNHVCLFRHNRIKWELKHELPLSGVL